MINFMHHFIVPAAYALLPEPMNSLRATAMLLSIGLQESKFEDRRQLNGPARGFFQFEMGGGVKGVATHRATKEPLTHALRELRYPGNLTIPEMHFIIEHNDVLACVFARLLLWTLPGQLPHSTQADLAWSQYIDGWRPGKPHRSTWSDNFTQAWAIVSEET